MTREGPRARTIMRAFTTVLFLLGVWSTSGPVQAAGANKCQDCRDYRQACIKAHSQQACKSEYDICMRHCQRK
jgi:hypothetical protein